MKYIDLTAKEQMDVLIAIINAFPELKENNAALIEYLNDKDDFRRVNIAEEDEDPIYEIEW